MYILYILQKETRLFYIHLFGINWENVNAFFYEYLMYYFKFPLLFAYDEFLLTKNLLEKNILISHVSSWL